MKLNGTMAVKAPRLIVWHFLTNPEAVASCAPGVTINQILVPSKKFTATVSAGFSNVQAIFAADVEFVELKSPDYAKFTAHGVAPNGAVDVVSEMTLRDAPGGLTEIDWHADIVVVGQLVVLAGGRINMVTRHMTDEFFERMKTEIELIVAQRGFTGTR